jgi:RNA polymerase sigma-70 factor (ECF subfamily)
MSAQPTAPTTGRIALYPDEPTVLPIGAARAAATDGRCTDERAVAAALVRGERAALEVAFRAWGDLVHAMARQLVGRDGADDVTQQVFVAAWRSRDTFDPSRGEVPGWLVGITRNVARQHHRRRGAARLQLVEDVSEPGPPAPPAQDAVAEELLVASALRELPEEQREVLALSFYEDLTQQEVAVRLNVPLGTVKSRQRRGLQRLRRVLEEVGS